jgi:hypothetical protein
VTVFYPVSVQRNRSNTGLLVIGRLYKLYQNRHHPFRLQQRLTNPQALASRPRIAQPTHRYGARRPTTPGIPAETDVYSLH